MPSLTRLASQTLADAFEPVLIRPARAIRTKSFFPEVGVLCASVCLEGSSVLTPVSVAYPSH